MLIAKFDGGGSVLWAKMAGGPSQDRGQAIAVDRLGNFAITGHFFDSIAFDGTTLTSEGGSDIFVAMYDAFGDFLWARRLGTSANMEFGEDIAFDHAGNVIVIGNAFAYNHDILLAKFDKDGNQLWSWMDGGTGSNIGYGVTVNEENHIFITGKITPVGTTTFGSTVLTPVGEADVVVARFDPDGNPLWVQHAGSETSEWGQSIALDGFGNCYVSGNYEGPVNIGTTALTHAGETDIFVCKLGATTDVDGIPASRKIPDDFRLCQNYPNPFNPTTTFEYWLPKAADVTFYIYNMRGQRIHTLVDMRMEAGIHRAIWDARDTPSGIYIYVIQSGDFSAMGKCLLIK